MRTDIIDRKQEILLWIEQKKSKAFICKQLICKPETLESYLQKFQVVYKGNKGSKGKTSCRKISALEYAKKDYVSAHKLKIRLIEEGIKNHKCEVCGITEWMSKKVPIELDHIDGNHFNNELSNLRIICPNCHAQTDTNSGKNTRHRKNKMGD